MAGTVNRKYTWTPKVLIGSDERNDARILVWDSDSAVAVTDKYTSQVQAAISEDGGAFTNETTDANDDGANDITLLPTPAAATDRFYFGYDVPFESIKVNVGTAGAGTYTLTWQYYNGSAWTALTVTDGTTHFKTSGENEITFKAPDDWEPNTVNSQGPFYYVRCTRDGGTQTTQPLGTRIIINKGQIPEQELVEEVLTVTATPPPSADAKTPHKVRTIYAGDIDLDSPNGKYATIVNEFSKDLGGVASLNTIFKTIDPYFTQTLTTVAGWTNITFTHGTDDMAVATTARTILDLYMRCVHENYTSPQFDPTQVMLTADGVNFDIFYDLTVTSVVLTSASQALRFDTGKSLTLAGTASISGALTVVGNLYINTTQASFSNLTVTGNVYFNVAGNHTVTFTNVNISGSIQNDNAANTLTINAVNSTYGSIVDPGTGNGETNWVANPVALTYTVKDAFDDLVEQDVAVTIKAAAAGPLPFEDSVTITRSGSTATVSHTGHGLTTGQKVAIEGADQNEYNRIKTITVTGANSYTYQVSGTPATPATGTITATAVIIDGLTDASGQISDSRTYSSNQDFTGILRKGTGIPIFKEKVVSGTIDKDSGTSITETLSRD